MEAIAGQFKFQVANPQTMDEAIHRASSIRRAATEAYQWLEASDALKKAAGSRARLPRLELMVEGSMVMFYEPPVSRRGLARRLQDQVSWVGPAVVVAVERFDGAIKRVWIRYRHKLRGLPLEHVRLATGDEIESTKVTKEALQDLMKKLQSGRVNADIVPEDEPVSLPAPVDPDPRYPPIEFSDDEQPVEDKPVRVEDLHRATSVLDDIPISVAQKIKQKADQGQADRSTRRKLDAEASSIRATVASSSAVDPALTSVRQKRDFYETAFKSTQEHLKKMKTKLEKKEAMVVVPVRDCELVEEGGESEVPNSADPCYSPFSEDTNETSPSMDSPFIEVDMFAVPNVYDDQGNPHEVSHDMYVVDMLRECPPINVDYDVLEADWRPDGERRIGIRRRNPTPCIRAKVPVAKWRMLGDVPGRLRRPLTRTEIIEVYKKAPGRAQVLDELSDYMEANLPGEMLLRLSGESDYWLHAPSQRELWRVHLQPRQYLFVPGVIPDEDHPQDAQCVPSEVPGLQGLRATQVGYLSPQASKEYLVDNIFWKGWNASVHMNQLWRGVTRFVTMDPMKDHPILATWNQGRAAAEDLWRRHLKANAAYQVLVAEGHAANFIDTADGLHADQSHRLEVALDVLECFQAFQTTAALAAPTAHPDHRGLTELCTAEQLLLVPEADVEKPETGKMRLELQWTQLSMAWQKAFEQPILDALQIYFDHDALAPVMPEEEVHASEVLPSRFVLVNKADPKNIHPTDEDLALAKLKARLVIAGHRDQRAGDYATDAPTASLVAHNFLCFVAAQFRWRMYFADISAAFLQGDYLPEGRRVFVQSPKNYPLFVRQFLLTKVPPGARTDLFRMKKAGFGLAESPRLWYQRFSRDIMSIGGKELRLAPGVFAFYDPEGQVWAMLAVHVDDVRFIGSEEAEHKLWPQLKSLFTFGDWVHPKEDTKFCGLWERQNDDYSITLQMNEYSKKVKDPPSRSNPQSRQPLMPNEKAWIGTIIGQLSWLARQVRADLLYGCSRIQQLNGTNDPTALSELKILVERAREPHHQVFRHLGCHISDMMVLAVSDASFGGMPKGRSQGGMVLLVANPKVLEGEAPVNILAFHSGLLKRVVRSSLAAEVSQAAMAMEEADFLRALMAEALEKNFSLKTWLQSVARWRQVAVMDSKTGYDLLNGTSLGEDKRLAIDVASMRQALHEDGGSRMVRWVPGEEILADDLTKLVGNQKLVAVMEDGMWALKDTEEAKRLRADAAVRKRTYRRRRASAP